MPITRAMEEQLNNLLEKLGEMKSDMTASMNANKEEIKDDFNMKLSANKEEIKNDFNIKPATNKEELKKDFKEIMEDKLKEVEGRMDEKFGEMEGKIEAVESKFEGIEYKVEGIESKVQGMENKISSMNNDMNVKIEEKIRGKVESVFIPIRKDLENLQKKVLSGQGDEFKFQALYSKPSIKLSTYDGKSSWQVYKTQFCIVPDANQWESQTKACQLAASLRADAVDILQTLPEQQRLDFDALANALELLFGEKCVKEYSRLQLKSRQQKVSETLQELATDRLSHLTFSDCPAEMREVLALQHFIDGIRDPEIQKTLRMVTLRI